MNSDRSGGSLLRKNKRDSQACKSASGLRKTNRQTGNPVGTCLCPEPSALERYLPQVHVVNNRSRDQLLLSRKAGAGRGSYAGQAHTPWARGHEPWDPTQVIYLQPALPHLYIDGCLLCVVQTGKGFLSFSASWLLSFVNLDVPLYPVSMLLLPQVYPEGCAPITPLRGTEGWVRVI